MYHKWQPYDVWFLRYEAWQRIFFVILDCFLPCYPPNNPKSQNFEKLKKTPGDIIILQKCTKNHDHMLYCSWDMVHDRCSCYFFILGYFCPFYSPNWPKKTKLKKKKWEKRLEISSFYSSVPKIMIICYNAPGIWCATDRWMNGQIDGRTEKVTYRGGCPT